MNTFTTELTALVRRMCYHPDDLKITDAREGNALDIHFDPHAEDRGILIGSNERIINAIRQVSILAGRKFGLLVYVHVDGQSGFGTGQRNHMFEHNLGAYENDYVPLIGNWFSMMFNRTVRMEHEWDGEKLVVRAELEKRDNGREITAHTALNALSDLIYAIGQREGVIVKLKPLKERQAA